MKRMNFINKSSDSEVQIGKFRARGKEAPCIKSSFKKVRHLHSERIVFSLPACSQGFYISSRSLARYSEHQPEPGQRTREREVLEKAATFIKKSITKLNKF